MDTTAVQDTTSDDQLDPQVAVNLALLEADYLQMSARLALQRTGGMPTSSDNLIRDLSPFGR